ncbi:NUDIX domain-containing protein [Rhodohalobacter halophilus]|uniref:NUDIX domain-containing protein n=1 Tax=Rhodohalobacter halophilus TaxID=1812810 RepID=UPI000A067823|nr:NUDIX hydrolase [Rhodohalobacter halophilus]
MKKKDLALNKDDEMKLKETTVSSRHVFDGALLQVYVDDVTLPDGSESTRDWIKHPGASAVVPVFEDGSIMLLKQFRYPPRKLFIEVPAGKIDPGETPESTALREMEEESGLSCKNLVQVGSLFPAIGYADEEIFVFVGWDLESSVKQTDDDEFLINHKIHFSEALRMIQTGELKDAKTITAIIQTYFWWKENEPFAINFEKRV